MACLLRMSSSVTPILSMRSGIIPSNMAMTASSKRVPSGRRFLSCSMLVFSAMTLLDAWASLLSLEAVMHMTMEFNRNLAHCCGGGGGVRSAFPEDSKRIAQTRIDEADFADCIITTCPFCVSNLQFGLGDRQKRIVDLIELVDELL